MLSLLLALQGPATIPAWTHGATCYEVFVRSFYDSNGDGTGDLNGVTRKLDYIQSLGASCIWLMPIMVSPSYHGYDVVDYYTVEPAYGTNDDFKRLVAAAHRRHIAVLIDMVLNHTSSENPWFKAALADTASPYRSWYRFSPTDLGPGPWGAPAWHKSPARDEYYYGVFWGGMPDLNWENPAVLAEAEKIADFWLRDMGVDGFRLDAVPYLVEEGSCLMGCPGTHTILREYSDHLKAVKPDVYTVGEVWSNLDAVLPYYPDQLTSYFGFELADSLISVVRSGTSFPLSRRERGTGGEADSTRRERGTGGEADSTRRERGTGGEADSTRRERGTGDEADSTRRERGTMGLLSGFMRLQDTVPPYRFSPFLSNHDGTRVMTLLGNDVARAKLAATLLLTLPGLPFIYYGEEIGMTGDKPDERLRTPMQWAPRTGVGFTTGKEWEAPQGDTLTRNVAVEDRDPRSLLTRYRQLIHLRKSNEALATGRLEVAATTNAQVVAFLRRIGGWADRRMGGRADGRSTSRAGGQAVIVIANLGDSTVADLSIGAAPGTLSPGRYTLHNLLGGPSGTVVEVKQDGSFQATLAPPALLGREALVLEFVKR